MLEELRGRLATGGLPCRDGEVDAASRSASEPGSVGCDQDDLHAAIGWLLINGAASRLDAALADGVDRTTAVVDSVVGQRLHGHVHERGTIGPAAPLFASALRPRVPDAGASKSAPLGAAALVT